MKFQLTPGGSDAFFTGYGEGYVAVSGRRYETPLVLTPGRPVGEWQVAGFDALTATDFAALLEAGPEIVIFGTGTSLRFPRPDVTRPLTEAQVGVEVMDTPAACRTYNILLSEGRRVLAAILLA